MIMDTLNDYYPLYPENPDLSGVSESEQSENNDYIRRLDAINATRKRKKLFTFDDFCIKYSSDLWYMWCMLKEFTKNGNLFARMDYSTFCSMCYENSNKW